MVGTPIFCRHPGWARQVASRRMLGWFIRTIAFRLWATDCNWQQFIAADNIIRHPWGSGRSCWFAISDGFQSAPTQRTGHSGHINLRSRVRQDRTPPVRFSANETGRCLERWGGMRHLSGSYGEQWRRPPSGGGRFSSEWRSHVSESIPQVQRGLGMTWTGRVSFRWFLVRTVACVRSAT